MLKAQIIGHIGRDADVKDLNGDTCITFNVASQQGKDKNGNQRPSLWAKCVIWKKAGQSIEISKYLKKGTQVYCEGLAKTEHWMSRENAPAAQLVITVTDLKLLGSKNDSASTTTDAPAEYAAPVAAAPVEAAPVEMTDMSGSDDLPF